MEISLKSGLFHHSFPFILPESAPRCISEHLIFNFSGGACPHTRLALRYGTQHARIFFLLKLVLNKLNTLKKTCTFRFMGKPTVLAVFKHTCLQEELLL